MNKYYTGIRSRETPHDIAMLMTKVASYLAMDGFTLRSGAADGADMAFEVGATKHFTSPSKEIYIPWNGFNGAKADKTTVFNFKEFPEELQAQAMELASDIHPAWSKLSSGATYLHARNTFQVLGQDLDTPSAFVILYAPVQGDSVKGGTRTAFELAKLWNIPCFNLYHEAVQERFKLFVQLKERNIQR